MTWAGLRTSPTGFAVHFARPIKMRRHAGWRGRA
jgi:hypothetical protein